MIKVMLERTRSAFDALASTVGFLFVGERTDDNERRRKAANRIAINSKLDNAQLLREAAREAEDETDKDRLLSQAERQEKMAKDLEDRLQRRLLIRGERHRLRHR